MKQFLTEVEGIEPLVPARSAKIYPALPDNAPAFMQPPRKKGESKVLIKPNLETIPERSTLNSLRVRQITIGDHDAYTRPQSLTEVLSGSPGRALIDH